MAIRGHQRERAVAEHTFERPLLSQCSIVTITLAGDETRSIAPPMPLTSLPGIR